MEQQTNPHENRVSSVSLNSRRKDGSDKQTKIPQDTLAALRDGDHQAFSVIFLEYFEKVKRFIDTIIKSSETAEEMAQDIFVNIWQSRHKIDPERSFNSYIYTIARNTVFNYVKHQKVTDKYQKYVLHNADDTPSSEEVFIAKELDLLIDLVVERMPKQRRRKFECHRRKGMTNDEKAQELSMSVNAVNKHLRLAVSDIQDVVMVFVALMIT